MTNRGLRRSLIDFKRHPWLHFISTSTITLALLIVGVFFLCYRNLEFMADRAKAHSTGTAYLKDNLTDAQVIPLKEKILTMPGIRNLTFKTKDSVMDELQTFLGTHSGDRMPGAEIFPDVLEIELKPGIKTSEVADLKTMIAMQPEISDVDFSEDWMAQFQKLRHFLGVFGLVLTVGAIVGSGFIIANFMGMRHQSRRSEIDIVRLHGAHQNFILSPFLWEGAIEGIVGSVMALVIVFLIKSVVGTLLTGQWATMLGITDFLYLSFGQSISILFIGIAMAFFGSVTVFLRFQESSK